MRITAQAKQETRERILRCARELFGSRGFEATSTRDLAAAAGIAAGTLFNYAPSKEDLAMALLGEALEEGTERWRAGRRDGLSLEEQIFALVASLLRSLRPHRPYVGEVLARAMSPFVRRDDGRAGDAFRAAHLQTVGEVLTASRADAGDEPSFVAMHLYWTLFLGVLAFWSHDDSPHQQDTLAVLDESTRLFAASLAGRHGATP